MEAGVIIRALFLIAMAVNVIAEGVVGFYLLFTAYKKSETVRTFVRFNFALAFWALTWFISQVTIDHKSALFWNNLGMFFASLFPILYLDYNAAFARTFTGFSYFRSRIVFYIIAVFFSSLWLLDAFAGSSFLTTGLSEHLWFPRWPDPSGTFFPFFLVYFCIGFTWGSFLLWQARKKADKAGKTQINIIFWCTAVAAVSGTSQYLTWYDIAFPPLGGLVIPLYVFGLLYTVIRFELFSVKVITAQLFTFCIWVLLSLRILLSQDQYTRTFDISIFLIAIVFGFFTIRSVSNEVHQKEKLKDLNIHLEDRVAEQTIEIRKAYEVEKKARIELEELDKTKDQFILTTQHHLRTPLTIIKGFLDSVLFTEKNLSPQSRVSLTKVVNAADRMAGMVNDFLAVSQYEVGKLSLNKHPQNVWEIVNAIYQELISAIEVKKLDFKIIFSAEAKGAEVNADKMLREALTNIIDNSVKYTERGRILITAEIISHPIEKIRILRVEIKDTGIGIPTEDIPKMFKRYFERGIEAQKMYTTGKGIGLTLARSIIQAHNGSISVSSEGVGKGSTFALELPVI
ncbi:MAG: ATP-binding protein [Patescibacteria group bacterium]